MKRLQLIAAIAVVLAAVLAACSGSGSNETTLKAKGATIDGKVQKDVTIVDGSYTLAIDGDGSGTTSYRLHTTVTFSLVNPLTGYTSAPQLELLHGDEVVATLVLGQDAGDLGTMKSFGKYCHGVLQRTYDAPFYYNTDSEEEARDILARAKTFRIINMFEPR